MLKPALVLSFLALASATEFAYKSATGTYFLVDPESGWRSLSVTTSDPSFSVSPRQAGYDAVASSKGTWPPNDSIVNFVNENDAFVESMVDSDLCWSHVGDVYARSEGMLKGHNESPCSKQPEIKPLSKLDWNLLQMDGDLFDLMTAYPDKETLFEQA
ncbi:hypothetical protein TrLO_g10412 [Triparma laevis f. longispina]|uniref:Phospholipase B-like n=1 Tax=Triparma laevis f. longispina TaxID=1714387 RepID=A0A9W7FMY4_9STRA|nr:hypothetical protein TrLO_g10412 [Triparma laevis f. longispina]